MTRDQARTLETRARSGEAAPFGLLIREMDRDLRGAVWAVVQCNDATNDVMQTAYEKAFRSIRSFDGRSSLKTWVHTICYRAAIDYVRYENRRRHVNVDEVAVGKSAAQVAAPNLTDRVDDRLDLDARLQTLDPEQRALLMLTVGMGYSFDETAEIVGMKRGTVASKVSRARARLTREVEQ